jgi:ABC-type Fe3+-hydroxamate transport system substrate-binding protein
MSDVRVVSLVPSATETLLAWGVEVMACTRFCEQPDLRHVGGTKDPDLAAIVGLQPDVVVMDREENRRPDAEALQAAGCEVHVMHVVSVATSASETDALARRVGVEPPGWSPPTGRSLDRTAFIPIWKRPWMSLNHDTYAASLLAILGIGTVMQGHPDRYPRVTLDEVAAKAPQLVLLPSEPYPFAERHVAPMQQTFPDAQVHLVDGQDLVWWGHRTSGAIARLAQQLGAA